MPRRFKAPVPSRPCRIQNQAQATDGAEVKDASLLTTSRANVVSRDATVGLTLVVTVTAAINRRKKATLGPRRAIARSSQRML